MWLTDPQYSDSIATESYISYSWCDHLTTVAQHTRHSMSLGQMPDYSWEHLAGRHKNMSLDRTRSPQKWVAGSDMIWNLPTIDLWRWAAFR